MGPVSTELLPELLPRTVESPGQGPGIPAVTWASGGAACRNRTDDLLITSEPLCRLS